MHISTSISKQYHFEAAHQLVNHPGKCRNLHGHSYVLEVTVEREVNPETGMVMDFADIDEVVEQIVLKPFDHTFLNETLPELKGLTTAENLAQTFMLELFAVGLPVTSLTLWETDTSCATVRFSQ